MTIKDNEAKKLTSHSPKNRQQLYDYEDITPRYYATELSTEAICDQDNRIKVIDTSKLPYKAICKLFITASNGKNLVGTGWLTHRNKLYTAGHNVFDEEYGGWMDTITVVPGMTGNKEPYGRYEAAETAAPDGWIKDRLKRYDMGAIKLFSNVSQKEVLKPTLDDANQGTVCGYPVDRDRGKFQYKMMDSLRKSNGQFFYQIDTEGGQSGSPLLKNNSQAIGIHNYGGCDNFASDLYKGFVEYVNKW